MVRQIMEVEFINGEKEEVIADRMITKSKQHFLYYGSDLVKSIPMENVSRIQTIMSSSSLEGLVEELRKEE